MIERPPSRGLNADDTACQRPLAGISGSGPGDLQMVNAGPLWCQRPASQGGQGCSTSSLGTPSGDRFGSRLGGPGSCSERGASRCCGLSSSDQRPLLPAPTPVFLLSVCAVSRAQSRRKLSGSIARSLPRLPRTRGSTPSPNRDLDTIPVARRGIQAATFRVPRPGWGRHASPVGMISERPSWVRTPIKMTGADDDRRYAGTDGGFRLAGWAVRNS